MRQKTYDYIVTLKPVRNYAAFDWISLFLLLIAIAKTAAVALTTADETERIKAIVLAIAILGTAVYSRITGAPYRLALFIAFISWIFVLHEYIIAVMYALCGIIEKQVKFKREFGFDDEGLTINTFPGKTYKWPEVKNIILKDNIITVDFHNNKIIQKELDDDSTVELEKEFNEFCRSHLVRV